MKNNRLKRKINLLQIAFIVLSVTGIITLHSCKTQPKTKYGGPPADYKEMNNEKK